MSPSKPSIPHLFDSHKDHNVLSWETSIKQNPAIYQNCFVRRITHVKDLNNKWVHEFLQVIVEDNSSKFCTRLITERLQERDQVTIGKWEPFDHYQEKWTPEDCYYEPLNLAVISAIGSSGSSGGSSGGSSSGSSGGSKDVLPMPLLTRSLPPSFLSVRDFAKQLGDAHRSHPRYNFFVYNCYWFAECVYEAVRRRRPSLNDYCWEFANKKRCFIFVQEAMRRAARKFLKLQGHFPIHAPGDESKLPTSEDYTQSLKQIIRLAEDDVSKNPTEATSMTEEEIEQAKTEYHESIGELLSDLQASDDWERTRDIGKQLAYETGWKPSSEYSRDSLFGDMIQVVRPNEEESHALDEAIWSFIGRGFENDIEDDEL